jgi:hypothetical protein
MLAKSHYQFDGYAIAWDPLDNRWLRRHWDKEAGEMVERGLAEAEATVLIARERPDLGLDVDLAAAGPHVRSRPSGLAGS